MQHPGNGHVTMLNIGRMAPGSHDYYLSVVADGAEDYYLRRGEAPGRWLGAGAVQLELAGQVEAGALRRVLAGDHPATGERLAAHPARKVPGFDLTFRAPKSVSLLWGLGDEDTAGQVVAAHDAAVAAAVGYLQDEAARTRRGAGGVERVEVDGLVAAGFRHRTSRAGDPLLHTHVLVANLARTCDDRVWRTLESRRLFLHAKTAGYLYQAHLRHELTRRLGVGWGPVVNGHADLDGIPRDVVEAFSRRRRQILDRLAERGESSARAAQVATLETRAGKPHQVPEADLRADWARRARQVGFDPATLGQLQRRHRAVRPDVDTLAEELVGQEALTEKSSTFGPRDLLRAVAERLPDGAPVDTVRELSSGVLARSRGEVVTLGPRRGRLAAVDTIRRADGRIVAGDVDEARMTTRGLLLVEHHAVARAVRRQDESIAAVPARLVADVASDRPSLTDEQQAMVARLLTAGDGVTVVVGRAGTGKTFALDAARDGWSRAGIPVRGVELAARAARELQDSSGIASGTIHRLLAAIDGPTPGSPLQPGSVLVVDEAGMIGTRMLARLLAHADRQHVKVVLVGDPHQLPEVDAGGLFAALATRLDTVELTDNRRQHHRWETAALDQLRHGHVPDAIHTYRANGRIVTGETAEAVREQLVADWWQAFETVGAREAVMVALRHAEVTDLNDRARDRLDAAGRLAGPALHTNDGTTFQTGDRVVCLRNDPRLGVVNGTFATIETVDPTEGSIDLRDDHGHPHRLPASYVDARHLAHGYAITGHKAQGLTVDHTFVLGSPGLYREWGYVALSRGRDTNRMYIHAAATDPDGITHSHQPAPEPLPQLTGALTRSRAQTSVSEVDEQTVAQAARWRDLRLQLAELGVDPRHPADQQQVPAGQLDQARRVWRGYTAASEAIRTLASHRTAAAEIQPHDYILRTIGARPDDPDRRQTWRTAVRAVEAYRACWHITDPTRPLGRRAEHPAMQPHRQQVMRTLLTAAPHREHHREPDRSIGRAISR